MKDLTQDSSLAPNSVTVCTNVNECVYPAGSSYRWWNMTSQPKRPYTARSAVRSRVTRHWSLAPEDQGSTIRIASMATKRKWSAASARRELNTGGVTVILWQGDPHDWTPFSLSWSRYKFGWGGGKKQKRGRRRLWKAGGIRKMKGGLSLSLLRHLSMFRVEMTNKDLKR